MIEDHWKNCAAIVTGGASGLGRATATRLVKDGLKVTIFDISDAGETVAQELDCRFARVNVSDPNSVANGIAQSVANNGTPRVLVNCAGIASAAKTVSRGEPHDPEVFEKTIAINLLGTFHCASQAAALMAAAEPVNHDGARGVVINTASVAAFDGQIGQLAYSASKGAIASMTLPMARDLADKGIRVCAIAPGLFLTPLLEGLPEEVQTSLAGQVPFPSRLGDPAEFAALVSHITSNSMLNGEVIRLDGAIRMAPR